MTILGPSHVEIERKRFHMDTLIKKEIPTDGFHRELRT